jgi:enoyl-CoA hydratase/carnithine racemase
MSDGSNGAYTGCDGLRADLGDDNILRLTLERVEKRNALDDAMVAALIAAV